MRRHLSRRMVFIFVMACLLTGLIVGGQAQSAQQDDRAVEVKSDGIGGVVASTKGPEAGVWVIAETTDLPTKFVKIVVTDDRGRYLLPDMPKAAYQLWVRGYGLVDSIPVDATPGKLVNLKAVIAPSPKDAAQYYPADYWLSLIKVPDKSEFPMKTTPAPAYQGQQTAHASANVASAQVSEEAGGPQTAGMLNQEQWIDIMKQRCELCHQLGDLATRDLSHLASYKFKTSQEAWATRIHFGQGGSSMIASFSRYVDQERAIKMFADWTDRIAAGEVPPAPPRPQGVERNIVISMWDWGKTSSFVHDEISTDRRHPSVNAEGRVYGTDYNNDALLWVDPLKGTSGAIDIPVLGDKAAITTTWPKDIAVPSPFFGKELALGTGVESPHNPMMDQEGRVWITANIRPPATPDYCREGSKNPFAAYFRIDESTKQASFYDPETGKITLLDSCFTTHHLQLAEDKDNTMYFSPFRGEAFGWINSRVLAETGDVSKAQGWCPAYLDTKGDGKIDPKVDKRINMNGYGVIVNPVDNSVWFATSTPVPGHLIRMTLGSNPPKTCMAEVYEPPFNNPKMPGLFAYSPRGIDVDRDGVIWTALSGSSQLASFDRRKCKVLNGPTATGQHCPEGWTLYTSPGPKMKGVTDDSSADFEYYNWVDQFNVLGLGANTPIINGTGSDSLEAFIPSTKKWVVMRVPYPLGFFSRGVDGRIDDPRAGWKGRGIWATYGPSLTWHIEGGPGTLSKLVKFQLRPSPLAD